ncbi:hypothetical protein V8E51_006309 [Hyaloscypha variabilis]
MKAPCHSSRHQHVVPFPRVAPASIHARDESTMPLFSSPARRAFPQSGSRLDSRPLGRRKRDLKKLQSQTTNLRQERLPLSLFSKMESTSPPLTFKISSAKTKTTPQLWSLRAILGSLEPNDEPASRTASPEPVQQDGINIATPHLQNQFYKDENHPSPSKSVLQRRKPPLTFKFSSAKTKTTPQLWSLRTILGSLEPNDEPASRTASPEPV